MLGHLAPRIVFRSKHILLCLCAVETYHHSRAMETTVATLASATRALQQEVRRAREQHRRQTARIAQLEEHARFLAIFADVVAAEAYLRQKWRSAPVSTLDDTIAHLRTWHATLTKDDVLREQQRPWTPGRLQAATMTSRFLHEHELHRWVHDQNFVNTLAPTTNVFLEITNAHGYRTAGAGPRSSRQKQSIRQWCRRWRRRWQVSLGTVPRLDAECVARRRQKASGRCQKRVRRLTKETKTRAIWRT